MSGNNTILGETISKNILFASRDCSDIHLPSSVEMIDVKFIESYLNTTTNEFNYHQIYDRKRCVFENLTKSSLEIHCFGCEKIFETPYSIGDCVLLPRYDNDIKLPLYTYFDDNRSQQHSNDRPFDPQLYPERRRKKCRSDLDVHNPNDSILYGFNVGYIDEIIHNESGNQLKLNIFYKPENIFENFEDYQKSDCNLLFWSNQTNIVQASKVYRKCRVIFAENITNTLDQDEFFYFNHCYDHINGQIHDVSDLLKTKFFSKSTESNSSKNCTILDLFSGCGGLSYGFASLASKLYAIEKDRQAAQTFKCNYKDSIVFNADANLILRMLINNQDEFLSQKLPPPGKIDIIIGGPPCQGFSEMNRFSNTEYSLFKRSLLVCYLNFLEFYRPKYFLFENVYNMICYGKSLIFKIFCSFLIQIGYQIRIVISQAGCYGLPQNRRRLFIVGAKSTIKLPEFPLPTHIFQPNKSSMIFRISDEKFDPFNGHSGVFRMVTIEDAIGDLIALNENDYFIDMVREYKSDPKCQYQRKMRNNKCNLVTDHYCKQLSKLNIERIKRIPFEIDADWRDLPNIR